MNKLDGLKRYSRIIWGLFIQTFRLLLTEVKQVKPEAYNDLNIEFARRVTEVLNETGALQGKVLSHEYQSYFEELLKTRVEILTRAKDDASLVDLFI